MEGSGIKLNKRAERRKYGEYRPWARADFWPRPMYLELFVLDEIEFLVGFGCGFVHKCNRISGAISTFSLFFVIGGVRIAILCLFPPF
jgi:hypothetical protein